MTTRNTMIRLTAMLTLAPAANADIINVPGDWPLIQMAIGVAADGDEIVVQPGEYLEHLDLQGKAITIRSIDPTNPLIVDLTRIVGPAASPTVQCVRGESTSTILRGLTFTHLSSAASDSGMYIEGASPKVEYCVFLDNHASAGGGGVDIDSSHALLRQCTFLNNSATEGGGAYLGSSAYVTFEDCDFRDNDASEFGGGLYTHHNACNLYLCTFSGNTSQTGGGIYLWDCDTGFAVEDCTITGNDASGNGGGIFLSEGNPQLTSCIFEQNTAVRGGGIYTSASTPSITTCVFSQNTTEKGAGAYNRNGSPSFTSCDFLGNTASDAAGAVFNDTCNASFTDCYFEGNGANRNGAMRNWLSDPRIVSCTFMGDSSNSQVDSIGGIEWTLDVPNPPPAMGACCLGSRCVVTTEGECLAAGGTYQGNDTACADITCPEECLGDLNGDGVINQADLGILLSVYGQDCP